MKLIVGYQISKVFSLIFHTLLQIKISYIFSKKPIKILYSFLKRPASNQILAKFIYMLKITMEKNINC